MSNQKPLQSQLLRNSARIQLAATKPFHSLKEGEPNTDAVFRLQRALERIEKHSNELPPNLLPHPLGPSGPPGIQWGPFALSRGSGDSANESFGFETERSVSTFQRQAGLENDGKAGMDTLHRLDEIEVFIEARHPGENIFV